MQQFSNALAKVEELFIAVGILVPAIVLFANVVLRYFFNSGWVWAEELARYLIVWTVFVGASCCVRLGLHLAVDAIVIRLAEKYQRLVKIAVSVICFAFCIFLIVYGWEICRMLRDTEQITPGLEMPVYYAYLAMPVGGALMGFRFIEEILRNIKALAATH